MSENYPYECSSTLRGVSSGKVDSDLEVNHQGHSNDKTVSQRKSLFF